jgi:hypothetical protein
MLTAKLIWSMTLIALDIETVFVHGNLNEEIYMHVPQGLSVGTKQKINSTKNNLWFSSKC